MSEDVIIINNMEKLPEHLVNDLKTEIDHGIEVSRLAGLLARELNLDTSLCHSIEIAAMLHDIGKLKESNYLYGGDEETLNVEKMRYVRMHSTLGYEVVKEQGYGEQICDIILHHHENYDGTGYPDNLVGEEIPLGARIIRVCDVFVALTTDRPYRKAFDCQTAMSMLIEEHRHFDMKVLLPFQSIMHDEMVRREMLSQDKQEI